jgi:hypothetical protein
VRGYWAFFQGNEYKFAACLKTGSWLEMLITTLLHKKEAEI